MSDIHERNLRKALKALYDDLLEAENGPDRNTFGFKHRLKVIHENLEEMMPRLLATFPHLGEFSGPGDFETEYYRRGDSGIHQLLKSEIKKLAIEIDADLEQNSSQEKIIMTEKPEGSFQKASEKNSDEIQKELLDFIRIMHGMGPVGLSDLDHVTDGDVELALFYLQKMEKKKWITLIEGHIENEYSITKKGMKALDNLKIESVKRKQKSLEKTSKSFNKNQKNLLNTLRSMFKNKVEKNQDKQWDIFICHATEDKKLVADPLAKKLQSMGLKVWYDDFELDWGNSLMNTIDIGLKSSQYGIVILSPAFFKKEWTKKELGGLQALSTIKGKNMILPLLYNLTHEELVNYSPLLSDILSKNWDDGLDTISSSINRLIMEKNN